MQARITNPAMLLPDAMQALQAYSWPGNVRELENVVDRAVALAPGSVVELTDLPDKLIVHARTGTRADRRAGRALGAGRGRTGRGQGAVLQQPARRRRRPGPGRRARRPAVRRHRQSSRAQGKPGAAKVDLKLAYSPREAHRAFSSSGGLMWRNENSSDKS